MSLNKDFGVITKLLRDTLADFFSDPKDIERLISDSGMTVRGIPMIGNSATNIWFDVIREAEKQNKIYSLLKNASNEYPLNDQLFKVINNYKEKILDSRNEPIQKYNSLLFAEQSDEGVLNRVQFQRDNRTTFKEIYFKVENLKRLHTESYFHKHLIRCHQGNRDEIVIFNCVFERTINDYYHLVDKFILGDLDLGEFSVLFQDEIMRRDFAVMGSVLLEISMSGFEIWELKNLLSSVLLEVIIISTLGKEIEFKMGSNAKTSIDILNAVLNCRDNLMKIKYHFRLSKY